MQERQNKFVYKTVFSKQSILFITSPKENLLPLPSPTGASISKKSNIRELVWSVVLEVLHLHADRFWSTQISLVINCLWLLQGNHRLSDLRKYFVRSFETSWKHTVINERFITFRKDWNKDVLTNLLIS